MRATLVALCMILALTLSACGSNQPSVSPGQLFSDYARSTTVTNDRFPSGGGSSADRVANFAAYYTPEQLQAALLRAFECSDAGTFPVNSCDLNDAVRRAARNFAGSTAKPLGRTIVVRHKDRSLELITLYVVQAPGGRAEVIDSTGRAYTGLPAFRAHNHLLSAADTVLTLRNITSVPGSGAVITVTGHTPVTWPWWLLGVVVSLAVLGRGVVLIRRYLVARHNGSERA